MRDLIKKYNIPAPRYTSYPTVPLWNRALIGEDTWLQIARRTFIESNQEKGISLYIHLPFCESLCTYCGCNTRITKNHNVEEGYIKTVLKEWQIYSQAFGEKPVIRELHLGGGTPTFFTPGNLKFLIGEIFCTSSVHPEPDFSFEGHPNNTTGTHLQVLYDLGFRRVSFGIQDLNFKVQQAIHRIQPFRNVETVTKLARNIGYTSINFDLIYGLPFQTLETIDTTIDQVLTLEPERIAFYSYAHVPWLKPGQRGYSENDLPDNEGKRELYELGREKFLKMGYNDIGMDHFALPEDSLSIAAQNDRLHRNFMGYTVSHTELLIGLGTSAISDAKYGYMQNNKVVEQYKASISEGKLAMLKSHAMSAEDLLIRKLIIELLCRGTVAIDENVLNLLSAEAKFQFSEMEQEGLICRSKDKLKVTEKGRPFIRNIAMVLDERLRSEKKNSKEPAFSKAI